MKNIILIPILMLLTEPVMGQLIIQNASSLVADSNVNIVLENLDWEQAGAFLPAQSRVWFKGDQPSQISGDSISFSTLMLNKSTAILSLLDSIKTLDSVVFVNGMLDLNGKRLDLGGKGILEGEREGSATFSSTAGGRIVAYRILNSPSSANPGKLGLILTTASNLDTTLVIRGHDPQSFPGGDGVRRYFDFSSKNPLSPSNSVRIEYFDAELNGLNENDLQIFESTNNGNSWMPWISTTSSQSLNYIESTDLSPSSNLRWTLATFQLLPVEWLFFSAEAKSNEVFCSWETGSERNVQYFEVEKSSDGVNFIPFAKKMSEGKAGKGALYSVSDHEPLQGLSYYRVRQFDKDGSFSYSVIEQVHFESSESISLYPNPARNRTNVKVEGDGYNPVFIEVSDLRGRRVLALQKDLAPGKHEIPLEVDKLARGTYQIMVRHGQNQAFFRFVAK